MQNRIVLRGSPEHSNFVPRLAGFLSSTVMSFTVWFSTFRYGLDCELNIQFCAALVFAFWMVMLIRAKGAGAYRPGQMVLLTAVLLLLSVYMADAVWNTGYLTNDPLAAIAAEQNGIHNDTLFHVSIAQGIQNYGRPSFLVNSAAFYNYHFGSHAVLALLSLVSDIPLYFTYSFLYPVFFLPMYLYLIFSVGERLRRFFCGAKTCGCWSVFDLLFILWLVLPELPESFLDQMAIWKRSWIISESYLVALVFALLYLEILFGAKERGLFRRSVFTLLWELVLTPAFILAAALCKISVGFFLCAGIVYYAFRMHTKELRYWLLNGYYGVWFLLLYFLPGTLHSPFSSNTSFSQIDLLNFMKTYVRLRYWGLHVAVLYSFSLLFLFWHLRKKKLVQAIKSKRHIPEEILFWICLTGAIPGNLFVIKGGSAAYFIYVQQLAAVLLLIAYRVPDELVQALKKSKRACPRILAGGAAVCLSGCVLYNGIGCVKGYGGLMADRYRNGVGSDSAFGLEVCFSQSRYAHSSYKQLIDQINGLTDGCKQDYYLYVDESASVWERFTYNDSSMFFYPAMTGIVAIGELYYEDGQLYYNNNTPYLSGWYKPNPNEPKMTLETALEVCRRDGKTALIHLYGDTLEIIPVQ